MFFKATGIKALLIIFLAIIGFITVLALFIAIFLFAVSSLLLVFPVILIIFLGAFLFRWFNKSKKEKPKRVLDANYKIKK